MVIPMLHLCFCKYKSNLQETSSYFLFAYLVEMWNGVAMYSSLARKVNIIALSDHDEYLLTCLKYSYHAQS